MPLTSSTVIALDTSVLINFLCIDRMDLIARYSHQFIVTDHVAAEVFLFGSADTSQGRASVWYETSQHC